MEIDGHKYHSAPYQVARDRGVDRRVQLIPGWAIYRYPARDVLDAKHIGRVISEVHQHLTRVQVYPVMGSALQTAV